MVVEALNIATKISTPIACLGLAIIAFYLLRARHWKHKEAVLDKLPAEDRARQADEQLTRFGVTVADATPQIRVKLLKETLERNHQRDMTIAKLVGLAFVVCFAIAAISYVASLYAPQASARTQADLAQVLEAQEKHRQQIENNRRREEEERNAPYLKHVGGDGLQADGLTHLKFKNMSPTRTAVISNVRFTITDPKQLAIIEKVYPRKPPLISAKTDRHELKLIHGDWNHDTTIYEFYVTPDFHVDADKPLDLDTCIIDPNLQPMDFTGELSFLIVEGEADNVPTTI